MDMLDIIHEGGAGLTPRLLKIDVPDLI